MNANRQRSEGIFMKSAIEDRWLSVDEIAAYLGIKRDTVYKWIERKSMPAHKVGILWKFKKEEIDEWVRSGGAAHKASDHDGNCLEAE
jgi:excisionase family DNA binding protein